MDWWRSRWRILVGRLLRKHYVDLEWIRRSSFRFRRKSGIKSGAFQYCMRSNEEITNGHMGWIRIKWIHERSFYLRIKKESGWLNLTDYFCGWGLVFRTMVCHALGKWRNLIIVDGCNHKFTTWFSVPSASSINIDHWSLGSTRWPLIPMGRRRVY